MSNTTEDVPIFYAKDNKKNEIPILITLLMMKDGTPVSTPAVKQAVDDTIRITGRSGLILSTVSDIDALDRISQKFQKVMDIKDAFVLFRCQSAGTAERLMKHFQNKFSLRLLKKY